MTRRLLLLVRQQPIALVALFVALGGTSYAAAGAVRSTATYACLRNGKLRVVAAPSKCTARETAISFKGERGPSGENGAAGAAGRDGLAGAAGKDGVAGPAGRNGVDGATGPAGKDGADGRDGTDGVIGRDGVDGATGPAGETGPAGPQGPKGDIGPQGAKGDTGERGPQGETGPQGPAGPLEPINDLLSRLSTVDGHGSGLDADTLDGQHASAFVRPATFDGLFDTRLQSYFGRWRPLSPNGSSGGVDCVIGTIQLTAATYPPPGYMAANGDMLPLAPYTALFAIIGTAYGGNGQTTFQLPDLRSQAPNDTAYVICVDGIFPNRN